MRPEDVLPWLQATPFVPFRLTMNSGQTFEVRHPELIRLMRTSLIVTHQLPEAIFSGSGGNRPVVA